MTRISCQIVKYFSNLCSSINLFLREKVFLWEIFCLSDTQWLWSVQVNYTNAIIAAASVIFVRESSSNTKHLQKKFDSKNDLEVILHGPHQWK